MVITGRKFFFPVSTVLFEDNTALKLADSRRSSRLIVMSYNALPLKGFAVKEKKAGIIDLSGSIDRVVSNFNETAQKKISRTMRYEGFRFERHEQPFPSEGYELYSAFERGRGRKPFPRSEFEHCVLFLGYDNGQAVSGSFVYPTAPIIRARSFFSKRLSTDDHDAYKRVSYASNRIIYEICKWGIEMGRTGFDLGSVNMTETGKAGITNFKLTFNPRLVPEYTYTGTSKLFSLTDRVTRFLRH